MAAPPIRNPELVSALCVDCGLCCNGVLFGSMTHKREEDPIARDLGMKPVPPQESDGSTAMRQPCPQLDGTRCKAYGSTRLEICGAFFCKLAIGLDRGEVSTEAAHATTAAVHAKLDELAAHFLPGEDITAARHRWGLMRDDWFATPENARFHLLMSSLNHFLDRHFRAADQKVMRFDEADS